MDKKQEIQVIRQVQNMGRSIRSGKKMKKIFNSRYQIIKRKEGFWFPEEKYALYLDKPQKIW